MGTPHSPKFQHYGSLTIRLFSVISRILVGKWGRSYLSVVIQLVYSTAPPDWADRSWFSYVLHCFIPYVIWKLCRWICNVVWLGKSCLEFKVGHNYEEATKNICCAKRWRRSWSQYSDQMVQEILLRLQGPYHNAGSSRSKTVGSKPMLAIIVVNLVSSTWTVSGELVIFTSLSWWIKPHTTKLLQNFWLTLV